MLQAEIRAALGKRTSLGELDTRMLDTQKPLLILLGHEGNLYRLTEPDSHARGCPLRDNFALPCLPRNNFLVVDSQSNHRLRLLVVCSFGP